MKRTGDRTASPDGAAAIAAAFFMRPEGRGRIPPAIRPVLPGQAVWGAAAPVAMTA